MFELTNLSLCYPGAKPLFSGISFSLNRSEVMWLQGANGSGKTSLLYAISNIIPQIIDARRTGEIYLQGQSTLEIPVNRLLPKLSLSLSNPQWEFFFTTPRDEIIYALENTGLDSATIQQRLDGVLEGFGLALMQDLPSHQLSIGWQKMVSLAVHFAIKPEVLLLDEPLSGLSEANAGVVLNHIESYLAECGMVIVAEHSDLIKLLHPKSLNLSRM